MHEWRLTKYNPRLRDRRGVYQKAEWSSVADIGKCYDGKEFTLLEYLETENQYIAAIHGFVKEAKLETLRITGLEQNFTSLQEETEYPIADIIDQVFQMKNGQVIDFAEITTVCRLALRELIWCRLEWSGLFFVHFGYDYYVYIGSAMPSEDAIVHAESLGLFVESFQSPYHMTDSV